MGRIHLLPLVLSISILTGCSGGDAQVDAEFAEFCEDFFGEDAGSECADSSNFTTAEKREILKSAPEIDKAFDELDAQLDAMGAEMDAETEQFQREINAN